MHHYQESITNTKGDALTGYYVKVIDTDTDEPVDIYADSSATPIISVSGLANAAQVDADGMVDLWVDVGTYHLDIYQPDGTSLAKRLNDVPMNIDADTAAAAVAAQAAAEDAADAAADSAVDAEAQANAAAASAALALAAAAGLDPSEYSIVTPQMFGAVGDGVTDDGAAFVAAIAALKAAAVNSSGGYKGSTRLFIPAGHYYLGTTTLDLTHTFIIEGEGSGQVGGIAVKLRWSGAVGIRTQRSNTYGDRQVLGVSDFGADGSIIRNLALWGGYSGGATSSSYHGIDINARIVCEDVSVYDWGGNGFNVVASSGGGAGLEGNANCFALTRCSAYACKNGFYATGADANAGSTMACDWSGNREWGWADESFLGNTSIGDHAASNTLGPYKTTNVNSSAVIAGGYSEAGQPTSSFANGTLVSGGTHGAGVSGGTYIQPGTNELKIFPSNNILKVSSSGSSGTLALTGTTSGTLQLGNGPVAYIGASSSDGYVTYQNPTYGFHRFSGTAGTIANLNDNGVTVARGSLGYETGAGGAVTQATSRTTGVTINKACGSITLVSAAGSTSYQSFTVTNSLVAATDTVRVVQKSGTDKYAIHVTAVAAGSFQITYATLSGTTTEQPVFNFSVIKAVAA